VSDKGRLNDERAAIEGTLRSFAEKDAGFGTVQ